MNKKVTMLVGVILLVVVALFAGAKYQDKIFILAI